MNDKIEHIIEALVLNKKDDGIGLHNGKSGLALFYYY